MLNQKIFNNEIICKFDNIGNKLYNLKYSLDLYINYLESETEVPIKAQCLGLILREYFNEIKEDYNKLEEELGILF